MAYMVRGKKLKSRAMLFELEQNHIAIRLWKLNIPYYQLLKQIRPLNTSTVIQKKMKIVGRGETNKQTTNMCYDLMPVKSSINN